MCQPPSPQSPAPLLPIITGPTGVGKTDLALGVAEALGAEIVSADSMAVYRGMEAATAKPSPEQRARVPHHLIDIVTPDTPFTVADYRERATQVARELLARGKLPILVGGTRLYLKALTAPFFAGPGSDPEFRKAMEEVARTQGPEELHRRLGEVDPDAAARLHPRDLKRVIRALEVFHASGQPISQLQQASQEEPAPFRPLWIALLRHREELYERIDRRCDEMLAAGLVEEVRGLLNRYPPELPALQGHGYKEIAGYLLGRYPYEEGVRLLKRNTRRYAKRQLSWLRGEPGVHEVRADQPSEAARDQILALLRRARL